MSTDNNVVRAREKGEWDLGGGGQSRGWGGLDMRDICNNVNNNNNNTNQTSHSIP